MALGRERDRDVRDRAGPFLELRGRLTARQASDVDSGDLDAAGDAARRSGKRQAEHNPADDEDRDEREQTLNEQPT